MYIDQIRILPGAGKGARVLLFTGGAGSWKRRLVAGDAEVEPEDGPCSVRGFMGPDILSVLDLGLRGDELPPLLLAFGPAGGKWRAAGRCPRCRLLAFSAAHLHAQTSGDQKQNQIKHAKLTDQEIESSS